LSSSIGDVEVGADEAAARHRIAALLDVASIAELLLELAHGGVPRPPELFRLGLGDALVVAALDGVVEKRRIGRALLGQCFRKPEYLERALVPREKSTIAVEDADTVGHVVDRGLQDGRVAGGVALRVFARRDVGVGVDEPTARQRRAPDRDDRAVGPHVLVATLTHRSGTGPAEPLLEIGLGVLGAVFAALEVVAKDVLVVDAGTNQIVGVFEHLEIVAIADHQSHARVIDRDALSQVIENRHEHRRIDDGPQRCDGGWLPQSVSALVHALRHRFMSGRLCCFLTHYPKPC
jgi:hypothetical protein